MLDSEAGYTMADALAGLLMISLAMLGLAQALQVGSRLQRRTAEAVSITAGARKAQAMLDRSVAAHGPFSARDGRLAGDERALAITGESGAPIRVRLTRADQGESMRLEGAGAPQTIQLPNRTGLVFRYYDADGVGHKTWPEGGDNLAAIAIIPSERASDPLVWSTVWPDQAADCALDPTTFDCARDGP